MVNKDFFLSLGGFSEHYESWLEDVDFNLKAIIAGKVNYFIGNAVAYHYELETENESPDIVAKKSNDLQRLLLCIRQNSHNPSVSRHIKRFSYK